MLFLGIDLAWSPRNNSGLAAIEGNGRSGRLVYAGIGLSDEEIVKFVSDFAKGRDAIVAVDAPLVVPNRTGRRPVEAIVGDLFRKYNAGAHPANRERLGAWSNGKIRGEELVAMLERAGFSHDPYVRRLESCRKVLEVYPHPSMVVLFQLERILQYKAKPKRSVDFRIGEFEKYRKLLAELRSPSLDMDLRLVNEDLNGMNGPGLKRYEDMLDAVFCAYIAHYYWVHPDRCAVLGSRSKGYIVTPIFSSMRASQAKLKE